MPLRSVIAVALATAGIAAAQPAASILAQLDRFSRTFTGARAEIRRVTHNQGIPDDDVDTGTFLAKRAGATTQIRVDFKQPNQHSVLLDDRSVQDYRPKLNEIQVYDLSAYKDIAQKFFLLGFGMSGTDLAANYQIPSTRHETVDGQPATYLELVPKAPEVRKQLKSVEIWISDKTMCPVRQTFHMPDGGFFTTQFSNLEVNPKISGGAFELPKNAKRVKAN